MEKIKQLFGKRIKELREHRGLSQQELSELMDVDQRNLSNVECGKVFPSKTLDKLAFALEAPLPELFEFEHFELTDEMKRSFIKAEIDALSPEVLNLCYKFFKCYKY